MDGGPWFAPGDHVGRYRVIGELGRGGMASVWEVEDETGTRYALKSPEGRLDPRTLARFERELRALQKLEHRNLVTARDSFVENGRHFLVMEHVEGSSLDAVLKYGPIPVADALAITRQVLAGMGHAHAYGYVHRDLKPENVMLVGELVKVIDFGLVKPIDLEDIGSNLTTAGTVFGSPTYMSPEQALGHPVDGRSDLYSIGVMLFEMIAGVAPFEDPSPHLVMRMHVTDLPPRLDEHVADIPIAIVELVARALVKPPRNRYASAEVMLAALDEAASSL
jgi:eukaryotic-like serine/threonine-protein kinase